MKVWVILYTYAGYDGEIERLWTHDEKVGEEGRYLVFSSKELAYAYMSNHKLNTNEFEVKEVDIIASVL